MEIKKIRIIDEKGNARYVMPHIANNENLMKSYGYSIQDPSLPETDPEKPEEEQGLVLNPETDPEKPEEEQGKKEKENNKKGK